MLGAGELKAAWDWAKQDWEKAREVAARPYQQLVETRSMLVATRRDIDRLPLAQRAAALATWKDHAGRYNWLAWLVGLDQVEVGAVQLLGAAAIVACIAGAVAIGVLWRSVRLAQADVERQRVEVERAKVQDAREAAARDDALRKQSMESGKPLPPPAVRYDVRSGTTADNGSAGGSAVSTLITIAGVAAAGVVVYAGISAVSSIRAGRAA